MENKWKIIALVSIIVNLLFILLFSWGIDIAGEELQCSDEICYLQYDSVVYFYDMNTGLCECYDSDYNIVYKGIFE